MLAKAGFRHVGKAKGESGCRKLLCEYRVRPGDEVGGEPLEIDENKNERSNSAVRDMTAYFHHSHSVLSVIFVVVV
jgi:hypothetical protein